jgi:ABC-type Na+ efflux pump permease subunit
MDVENLEESEEKLEGTVISLQGSAAKVKKVLSDLQKESLKRARDSATIYRKQLRDEKQRLGIVDKKGLSKLQMRLRDLQRVDDPPPTAPPPEESPPEESAPEESVPEESVPEESVYVHGFFRDEWGNLFMK